MIAKLFGKEAASAALTIALTGTITVLVAKGGNPLSLKRIVAGGPCRTPSPVTGRRARRAASSRSPLSGSPLEDELRLRG